MIWEELSRREKDELLDYYGVKLQSKEKDFQTRARLLQSVWRQRQGLEGGCESESSPGSRLSMPNAKIKLTNYLTENIKEVVSRELSDNSKRPPALRGLYSRPRIYNNLLSSQPLCFNLFAELTLDLDLATKVFSELTNGRVARVSEIGFEFSPGRRDRAYTGDKSAFDVYVQYRNGNNKEGFVGIEVKYHESPNKREYSKSQENDRKRSVEEVYYEAHGDRYDDIAKKMDCFIDSKLDDLVRGNPIQQFWRDHLLVGVHKRKNQFDDAIFVILYPQGNEDCKTTIERYLKCIQPGSSSFDSWTLERFVKCLRYHSASPWIESFHKRYLDFSCLTNQIAKQK